MITKELIENFRETVKPFVSRALFGINYEGMGTLDCVEFERDFDEILDLAIKATEAEPCEDAVSRQEAAELVMKYCPDDDGAVQCNGDIRELLDELENLPTIQPVVTDTNVGDTISRQAALNICKGAIDLWHGQLGEGALVAVRDRISELPSVQPELAKDINAPINDTISRQAAIDALDCINGVEEVLRSLPSVQPEPKEGHWIRHRDPFGGEQYECSECGVLWEFNDGTPADNEAYFCPKCGTKMTISK